MAYKKPRTICVSLRRKSLKKHLNGIPEKGINNNKSFWKFIKPFLANKGFTGSNDITLVENNAVKTDEKTLVSTFNKHYINIVEISSRNSQKNLSKMSHGKSKQEVRCDILNAFKTHPGKHRRNLMNKTFFVKKNVSLSLLLHQKLKNLLIVLLQE